MNNFMEYDTSFDDETRDLFPFDSRMVVTKETEGKQLFDFIISVMNYRQVIILYKLLRNSIISEQVGKFYKDSVEINYREKEENE